MFPLSDSSLLFWSHLICIYCLFYVCDVAYYVCVSMFVYMCMVFHRFPSSDRSKAWPGGDSLYIYKNIYFTPPNLPTDHSKLITFQLFQSFSLCRRGLTYFYPMTWPLTFVRAYRNYYSYCFQRTATLYANSQTKAELLLIIAIKVYSLIKKSAYRTSDILQK